MAAIMDFMATIMDFWKFSFENLKIQNVSFPMSPHWTSTNDFSPSYNQKYKGIQNLEFVFDFWELLPSRKVGGTQKC